MEALQLKIINVSNAILFMFLGMEISLNSTGVTCKQTYIVQLPKATISVFIQNKCH